MLQSSTSTPSTSSSSPVGELAQKLQTFFAKAESRDKTGRFIQYGSRALLGLSQLLLEYQYVKNHDSIELLQRYQQKFRNIKSTLSDARRTHRWFKEIAVLLLLFIN